MSKTDRICFDRILPHELRGPSNFRAVSIKEKGWPSGTTLRIRFLGGTSEQRTRVQQWACQWTQFANLKFQFDDDPYAEIRVGFVLGDGSWSAIGTDALDTQFFPLEKRTMNFGWELDKGTVLHEFGHAIGLGHEHQNPNGSIQWNEQTVIDALKGPPNYWSQEVTIDNVIRRYSLDQINGTVFDPDSIMLYSFPDTWTINGVGTKRNMELSATDKSFMAVLYPRITSRHGFDFAQLPIDVRSSKIIEIGQPGKEDFFKFNVVTQGSYIIETRETTELAMRLYRPESAYLPVDTSFDNGEFHSARITHDLEVGDYIVSIRHYNRLRREGNYSIKVMRG